MKKKNEARQLVLEGTAEEEILAKLSQRVERAVSLIQELRRERESLQTRLSAAEERLQEQESESTRLSSVQSEYDRFQGQREEIKSRIERMLDSLESLEEEG